MAYVEGKESAERVLAAAGRSGLPTRRGAEVDEWIAGAMAVYLDRKGRPFAWQIPFDASRWDDILAAAGA
jgi:hypothetical protein